MPLNVGSPITNALFQTNQIMPTENQEKWFDNLRTNPNLILGYRELLK